MHNASKVVITWRVPIPKPECLQVDVIEQDLPERPGPRLFPRQQPALPPQGAPAPSPSTRPPPSAESPVHRSLIHVLSTPKIREKSVHHPQITETETGLRRHSQESLQPATAHLGPAASQRGDPHHPVTPESQHTQNWLPRVDCRSPPPPPSH